MPDTDVLHCAEVAALAGVEAPTPVRGRMAYMMYGMMVAFRVDFRALLRLRSLQRCRVSVCAYSVCHETQPRGLTAVSH